MNDDVQTLHPFDSLDALELAAAHASVQEYAPSDAHLLVQAQTEIPVAEPQGLERYMVQQDKLYVVLAVVLLIWFGLLFFLYRTDRRLARIERELHSGDAA